MSALTIALPTVELATSYLAGYRELQAEGRHTEVDLEARERDFAGFLARLAGHVRGEGLPEGRVPQTEYWIVEDGAWAGRIAVRHYLTPTLERHGGHLGYEVRPSCRGRRVATRGVALVLDRLRQAGFERILVTCDTTNVASQRVIQHNGGVLQDVIEIADRDVPTMRWWIAL